jgi:uncharacterized HAD superfamily protein
MDSRDNLDTVAVDIDGILTNETDGHEYGNRTPNLAAIKLLNVLHQYVRIVLYTARYPEDRDITVAWLKSWNVHYDDIVFGKVKYTWIVDDRSSPS